jgi:hypothetical protein
MAPRSTRIKTVKVVKNTRASNWSRNKRARCGQQANSGRADGAGDRRRHT